MPCKHSLKGAIYRSKRWAKKFAPNRQIRKTKSGWKIGRKKR